MTKVLIATDGSDLALQAATKAAALIGSVDSVTVLSVYTDIPGDDAGGIEGPTESPEEADRIVADEEREANAAIEAVIEALPEDWQAKVHRRVEAGDVGATIVWVAGDEHSDVVVVGSHGHGFFKRMVMGSASTHVMHHAPCAVLLVRAEDS